MRRVDEILAAFSAQDEQGQRYLIRCIETQPVGLDGASTLDFLRSGPGGPLGRLVEATVEERLASDRLLRAGGVPSEEAGQWSLFLGSTDELKTTLEVTHIQAKAADALTPLVPALVAQARAGGPSARVAVRVLGRVRAVQSLEALRELSANAQLRPSVYTALATFGGEGAGAALRELLAEEEKLTLQPWVLVHLRGISDAASLELLRGLQGRREVQPAIAATLEGFDAADSLSLFEELCASGEPWALMHSIESLGRIGSSETTEQLTRIHAHVKHPMVRGACLRALAETGVAAAASPALESLADPDGSVAAAAVEALVQLPVPVADYRGLVLPLVGSDHPRLAMAATLAAVALDPPRAAARIQELVQSDDPAALMAGIHCLAYIEKLGDDAESRRRVAWFLAGVTPEAQGQVVEVLAAPAKGDEEPMVLAARCEALGILGAPEGPARAALTSALGHEDSRVRQGAGWALAVAAPEVLEAEPAGGHHVDLVAWDHLASWGLRAGGVEELGQLLGNADAAVVRAGLAVARQAALEIGVAHRVPQRKGLVEELKGRGASLVKMAEGVPYQPPPAGHENARARHLAGRPGLEAKFEALPSAHRGSARDAAVKVSLFGVAPPAVGQARVPRLRPPGSVAPEPSLADDPRSLARVFGKVLLALLLAGIVYRFLVVGMPLP
jgi:HEAT repeat protein